MRDKHIFLADFGLSQVVTTKRAFGTKTMMSGTPGFQPPEQLMAQVLNERADVYAYGVLLVELFGEKAVWEGLTPFQIMAKVVIEGTAPDISLLPSDIKTICSECLMKKELRPPMSDVLEGLINTCSKMYQP